MRPILIRGLRRSFVLSGAPAGSPFEALRAEPRLFGPEPQPEALTLTPHGDLWRLRLPDGKEIDGTLCGLAAELDERLVRNACALEDGFALAASLLQSPTGERVLIMAHRHALRTAIVIDLLRSGWEFEGDSLTFIGRDGLIAHPEMLRVSVEANNLAGGIPASLWDAAPHVPDAHDALRAIGPDCFGQPWRIRNGPVSMIAFLHINEGGGLRGLSCISVQQATAKTLALATGKPSAASIAALMANLAKARCYRLQVSEAADARMAFAAEADLRHTG